MILHPDHRRGFDIALSEEEEREELAKKQRKRQNNAVEDLNQIIKSLEEVEIETKSRYVYLRPKNQNEPIMLKIS